ncbi:hypothetical protein HanRHA438_Chr10g0459881 [Helianthus annuus]|nr:hypothetical protein HanIR_Chr10g0482201 [Helianthus annuus]KAJ0880147.1 hypothetical protein HanRHA438_Chr10g0459881 [Helianthus annuus]
MEVVVSTMEEVVTVVAGTMEEVVMVVVVVVAWVPGTMVEEEVGKEVEGEAGNFHLLVVGMVMHHHHHLQHHHHHLQHHHQ